MDASHVYVRAWALGCFHSTQTIRRALTASVDSCAEVKTAPFCGETKPGRVWRKVPESDARSVISTHTPNIAFRHLPPKKDVVNQWLEFDQYPNLSQGADRVGGQLHRDKGAFSGITKLAEFGGRCRKAMLGVCGSPSPEWTLRLRTSVRRAIGGDWVGGFLNNATYSKR